MGAKFAKPFCHTPRISVGSGHNGNRCYFLDVIKNQFVAALRALKTFVNEQARSNQGTNFVIPLFRKKTGIGDGRIFPGLLELVRINDLTGIRPKGRKWIADERLSPFS